MQVPGHLMPLSGFTGDIARHFFGVLAPRYDLRPHLKDIPVPTLVIVGRYELWVGLLRSQADTLVDLATRP